MDSRLGFTCTKCCIHAYLSCFRRFCQTMWIVLVVLLKNGMRQSHGEPTFKTGVPLVRINLNDKAHCKSYSGSPVLDVHLPLMR